MINFFHSVYYDFGKFWFITTTFSCQDLFKWGILGASTIILSKDIDKYAFMCGSNFYETDVIYYELLNKRHFWLKCTKEGKKSKNK